MMNTNQIAHIASLVGEPARDTLVLHEHNTLSVIADATRLPDHIDVSIEGVQAGTRITAGSVVLPEGTELAGDPELVIASSNSSPTAAEMEPEAAEAPVAEAEPAAETAQA